MWPETLGGATFDPGSRRSSGGSLPGISRVRVQPPCLRKSISPRSRAGSGITARLAKTRSLRDMARAYVDGFQASEGEREIADGL